MSWRLFPRTNFGLFIVKAHERTVQVFERGWVLYMKMPEHNKNVVAKDQSIIHGAMQTIKWYGAVVACCIISCHVISYDYDVVCCCSLW